jgi:hypothetical protein
MVFCEKKRQLKDIFIAEVFWTQGVSLDLTDTRLQYVRGSSMSVCLKKTVDVPDLASGNGYGKSRDLAAAEAKSHVTGREMFNRVVNLC